MGADVASIVPPGRLSLSFRRRSAADVQNIARNRLGDVFVFRGLRDRGYRTSTACTGAVHQWGPLSDRHSGHQGLGRRFRCCYPAPYRPLPYARMPRGIQPQAGGFRGGDGRTSSPVKPGAGLPASHLVSHFLIRNSTVIVVTVSLLRHNKLNCCKSSNMLQK